MHAPLLTSRRPQIFYVGEMCEKWGKIFRTKTGPGNIEVPAPYVGVFRVFETFSWYTREQGCIPVSKIGKTVGGAGVNIIWTMEENFFY